MNMKSQMTLLIVEDSPTLMVAYQEYLRHEPCQVTYAETGTEAMAQIEKVPPDVILLDLGLPDMNGMEILKHVNERQLHCSVVVVTAQGSVEVAVEAMRYNAFDFIEKPFDGGRLILTIRNALLREKSRRKPSDFDFIDEPQTQYHGIMGASRPMQVLYQIINNAASSKATVFITGESGTGKELCAEAIHQQSPRKNKPFIAINCAAIPKELMESEIFGHTKGAFTSAVSDRKGAALLADSGTLFLDEIGDMSLDLQSKLLRFVQTGTVQKVGNNKLEKVDVRFICATNRDPLVEVQEGRFREDLYYRLHVIPISIPPLREREDDISLIAKHFLTKYTYEENKSFRNFAPETEAILLSYHWPGNVRQLQNVIRNIVVLNDGVEVIPNMLPAPLNNWQNDYLNSHQSEKTIVQSTRSAQFSPSHIRPLWQVEKETIEHAIKLCEGNVSKAAALLAISASTIYRKKKEWEKAESLLNKAT
jgi:two-component system repressor protein LuxO